jgi:menaquinone-specific isochorismate synthase
MTESRVLRFQHGSLERPVDPIAELRRHIADGPFAWLHRGDGFIGHGAVSTLEPGTGPGRFQRARELVVAALGSAGTDAQQSEARPGPIAVGSFTFDADRGGSVLRIPRSVLHLTDGQATRVTLGSAHPDGEHEREPDLAAARPATGRGDRPRFAGMSVPDERWLEAVQSVLTSIASGEVAKVVLARDQSLWSRSPFDLPQLVGTLASRFPSCFTFLVDGLVGASPELLVRRHGQRVESLVLAGTAARGRDASEDEALGAVLRSSDKDLAEHAHAVASVVEVLRPLCSDVQALPRPELLRLENVQHLATTVHATLETPLHVLDVVGLLHPTAAVGGTPRDAALHLIRAHEGLDRGRYTGPVGWCDAAGDGEWAIALRCAEVAGDRARLFAGAGIVDGSIPVEELRETWLKLAAMREALGA